MRVLAALLVFLPALAMAQPAASFHDLPIAEPVTRPFTDLVNASVASDGENFFAAWTDSRTSNYDIYGARFTAAGELLDPQGVPVHATYESESNPSAVWNGADYAVFSSSTLLGVWNTLVSPAGEVRGAPGERLGGVQNAPGSAVWNGSRYAQTSVTWGGSWNRLEVVLRDPNFEIVRRVTVAEPPGVPGIVDARIATDGRGFVVLWEGVGGGERVIRGAILDGDGNITTPTFPFPRPGTGADVAWNGTNYLATWAAEDGVRAVTIAPDGTRGAEKLVASGANLIHTGMAWDGHAHLVLWSSAEETRGALVTASGDVVETFDVAARGSARPAIASNGDVFFAVAAGETFVIRSTGATRIVRRGVLTNTYPSQTSPTLAAGATNVLTAWVEKGREIRMNRRLPNGAALDGSGVLVASGSTISQMKVFAARGFYVITWVSSVGEVRIARVTEGGEVIDPGGMVLAPAGSLAVAASNATETRVVWGRPREGTPLTELVTATLPERGPAGTPSIVAPPVPPIGRSRAMRLIPNGERFTLLYEVSMPGPRFFTTFDYLSLSIDASGRASSPTMLVQGGFVFDAATDGRSIVITWDRDGQHARRLDLDGLPVDAPVLLTPSTSSFISRIERTASGFIMLLNSIAGTSAVYLDRDGRPVTARVTLLENAGFSDAATVGGQTWITYTTMWRPTPQIHGGAILRSWLHFAGPRRRTAR